MKIQAPSLLGKALAPSEGADANHHSFVKFAPDSAHLHKAVARMNHLHSPYQKSGKITNRDLLYVLWASMAEPIRFMQLYEWRALTDMEVAAIGTLWKYIGDMMQIDYAAELGRSSWHDGIDFLENVTEWAYRYEDGAMKRLPEVQKLGEVLLDLFLTSYPVFVRPVIYKGVLVLMGDRMRHAFRYIHHTTLTSLVANPTVPG